MIYRIGMVLEALLIIRCIHDLYGEKMKLRTELVVFLACEIIYLECVHQKYLPEWCTYLAYIMLGIYCMVTIDKRIKKLLVNTVLSVVMLSILQIPCFCLVYLIAGKYIDNTKVVLVTYLLMWCLYMGIRRLINIKKISEYFQRSYVLIRLSAIFVCAVIIGGMVTTRTDEKIYGAVYIIVAVALVLVCVIAISWVKNKEKTIETEAQLKAYVLYEKSYENLILQIRAKQHEFNNHISAIYSQHMLYKDYDSLVEHQKAYCESVNMDNRYAGLLKCGNSVLVGFLYGKLIEAENRGIEVHYDIVSANIFAGIPEYKVIEILGNLVDNACDALEDSAYNKLWVRLGKDNGKEYVEVENLSDVIEPEELNRMFKRGYSSKGGGRGLGLYNVTRIAEEYGLMISCCNREYDGANRISFIVERDIGEQK